MATVLSDEQAREAIRMATIAEVIDAADRRSSAPGDVSVIARFGELLDCLGDVLTFLAEEVRSDTDGSFDVEGELTKLAGLAVAWAEDRRAG